MELLEGKFYHIYNRGNMKQDIFFTNENYLFFLKKIRTELLPYCEILAYCLMPNHFHLMIYVKYEDYTNNPTKGPSLNNSIAILLRSYTRALQRQENFTGSLFQQKTKSKELIGENDILTCAYYIHQNPYKANLVSKDNHWIFSSFQDYMGTRNGTLLNKELFYQAANITREQFIADSNLQLK